MHARRSLNLSSSPLNLNNIIAVEYILPLTHPDLDLWSWPKHSRTCQARIYQGNRGMASAFFRSSSRSLKLLCDSCCFSRALTFRCRCRRPLPRFLPSNTTGSVIFFFRFAACSIRCLSRFLSRLRNDIMEAFRRDPYRVWNLSNCPEPTWITREWWILNEDWDRKEIPPLLKSWQIYHRSLAQDMDTHAYLKTLPQISW